MLWFTFSQNNSGGFYIGPQFLIVEAKDADSANSFAEANGIYFDGCSKGIDCNCCGDRWHRTEECEGEEKPIIYGEVIDPENPYYQDDFATIPRDEICILRPFFVDES